jgi:serine/threonine protein phosphatase PrpC
MSVHVLQLNNPAAHNSNSTPSSTNSHDSKQYSDSSVLPVDSFDANYDWNDNLPYIYGGSRKGAKQWQEDSFFSYISKNHQVYIAGVFDGHGGFNGLLASNRARDYCKSYFKRHAAEMESWSVNQWNEKLLQLFADSHQSIREKFISDGPAGNNNGENSANGRYVDEKGIVRSSTGDPIHGGSTGSIVVLIKNPIENTNNNSQQTRTATIITANVGDSTCLLVPSRGKWEFLSVDHGPENPDEFIRVQSLDSSAHPLKLLFVYDKTNVFRKYECPCVFRDDGTKDQLFVANPWGHGLHPTNVRYEPAVYAVTPRQVSKDSTCIAMTRALGDFYAHQFGLSAVPNIGVKNITIQRDSNSNNSSMDTSTNSANSPTSSSNNHCSEFTIIVASDGVWDCWRYENFQEFVNDQLFKKKLDVVQTGESALDESITRAITNFGSKHYDDACLIAFKFTFDDE